MWEGDWLGRKDRSACRGLDHTDFSDREGRTGFTLGKSGIPVLETALAVELRCCKSAGVLV
jgi:hypothetical protein